MSENTAKTILSPLVEQGSSKFMSFIFHRYFERALWAFAELGVADHMASHQIPVTAAELSKLNGNNWNTEFLYRLLRIVSDGNIVKPVTSDDGDSTTSKNPECEIHFKLTDDGLLLTSDHPSKIRYLVRLSLSSLMEKPSTYLPDLIRNGNANGTGFEQAHGLNIFDYYKKEEYKEHSILSSYSMTAHSTHGAPSIASAVNFSQYQVLVDVGGSFGTLLSFILEKHQNVFGIVFDLPHVIENAQARKPTAFEEKQIEEIRYQYISGDMFKPETIPIADAYILKYMIHNWNDQDSIEIFKSIRLANRNCEPKTITIFIIEMMILSDDISNWMARAFDIQMLLLGTAKERTKWQYIELLQQGGYEFKQLYQTDKQYSIIEATTTNVF